MSWRPPDLQGRYALHCDNWQQPWSLWEIETLRGIRVGQYALLCELAYELKRPVFEVVRMHRRAHQVEVVGG